LSLCAKRRSGQPANAIITIGAGGTQFASANIFAGQRRYDLWSVNEDAQYHEAGEAGVQSALDSVRLVPEKVAGERAA
jgi:hypothetical protein